MNTKRAALATGPAAIPISAHHSIAEDHRPHIAGILRFSGDWKRSHLVA